ncbi:SpoIIE family protein phosphatase [Actinomadura syzygii]|uniref:SpoIIE family protein phosphatase n=1 Tax=Actinomadura syzygii TaxID=1427538 RepID=A0A5D0TVF8_9ACTN|nr:SpoIIE family protein phosphatase [Actinomadura syzygii]TYC09857.1 SpoIIE family protein phosphatase [Actinomadura syzygii]
MDDAWKEEYHGKAPELFDPAPVGVAITTGPDHTLTYTNEAFRRSFGDRAPGRPMRETFRDLLQEDYLDLFDRVLSTGLPVSLAEAPISLYYPDSGYEERFFSFSLSRISTDRPGILILVVDVTRHVMAAQQADHTVERHRRALHRFQSLLRVSADIVWVTNPEGEPIEPSPGWERVTGQTWEEFRGRGWLRALHPDDREPAYRSWRAAIQDARPWEYVYRLRTVDGDHRHFEIHSAPVFEDGAIVEWVGTCVDIEQRWRQERRRELLERAAVATAEHAGVREMLGALADVLVPAIADGCGVHLLPDFTDRRGGAPVVAERVATAARAGLPRQPPSGEEWFAADSEFTRTVRRRRPLHRTFPPGEPPRGLLPEATRDWLVKASANSVVMLPVTVDGTVAAVVTAAATADREPISGDDVALLGQLFDHAHDALSSAIQYQRTHQVALALQHSLLAEPPAVPDREIVARYRPSPATAEVGGDWYDSFVLPDGALVLAIGDVAGHDLAAAVAMSQLRNILRGLIVDREGPPGEILRRLNIAMATLTPDGTATCALAKIEEPEPGEPRLSYATAGHPPPLLVGPDGDSRLLEDGTNPLLGLGDLFDPPFRSATLGLPPRHTLLLYTDGLVERPGENLNIGLGRLRERAGELAGLPLAAFCDGLIGHLPTAGIDDMAMIALRRPG